MVGAERVPCMFTERERVQREKDRRTHPSGCCSNDTSSSTAVDEAIEAIPGRVTVHIWSSVRSVRDWYVRG